MRVVKPDWGYIKFEASTPCDLFSWKVIIFNLLKRNGGTLGTGIPFDFLGEDGKIALARCDAAHLEQVSAALNGEYDGRTIRVLSTSHFLPAFF